MVASLEIFELSEKYFSLSIRPISEKLVNPPKKKNKSFE